MSGAPLAQVIALGSPGHPGIDIPWFLPSVAHSQVGVQGQTPEMGDRTVGITIAWGIWLIGWRGVGRRYHSNKNNFIVFLFYIYENKYSC